MPYTPTSMISTSAGLAHGLSVYLTRQGLDLLTPNTIFGKAMDKFDLPKNNGKTIQMFRMDLLATNTTPVAAEGAVGTGKTVSSNVLNCSVAEYDDFISWSTFHQDTDITNVATEYGKLLSIQAFTSLDVLRRSLFDASAASTTLALTGTNFGRKDISLIRTKLQGANVKPRSNGKYLMVIHPNFTYDFQNDPTAGSAMDLVKFTDPQKASFMQMDHQGYIGCFHGVDIYESTNVYNSGGTYRGYAFGAGCAGEVNLAGSGPTMGGNDPQSGRFKINVIPGGEAKPWDPTGTHGGAVSYRYTYGATLLDGPAGIGGTYRYKVIDATTSVV